MARIVKGRHFTKIQHLYVFASKIRGCAFIFDADDKGRPRFENEAKRADWLYCLRHREEYGEPTLQVKCSSEKENDWLCCNCGVYSPVKDFKGRTQCLACGDWYSTKDGAAATTPC